MVDTYLSIKENLKGLISFTSPKIYSIGQFIDYLSEIYRDLTLRCDIQMQVIDIHRFHYYLQLPFFLSKTLFKAFVTCEQPFLSFEDFQSGFKSLFFDTTSNRILFLFKYYDINGENEISSSNICLILKQFHMINNSSDINLLDQLLSSSLGTIKSMDLNQWKELIINNSDIFTLTMIYFTHFKPFNEENIALLSKCSKQSQNNTRDVPIKTLNELADSSELLYTYVNTNFNKTLEYIEKDNSDNDDDIKELNAFEEDKNELINHLKEIANRLNKNYAPSKKRFETQITKNDFHNNGDDDEGNGSNINKNKRNKSSFDRRSRKKEIAATTIQKSSILSQLRLKNGMIETLERANSPSRQMVNNYRTECFCNIKGELKKCTLNLLNRDLFVLKHSKKTNVKKFKKVLSLKRFYYSTDENSKVQGAMYYKVEILNDFDYKLYATKFYFERKESGIYFINQLKEMVQTEVITNKYDIDEELKKEENGTLLKAYSKKNLDPYLIKHIPKKNREKSSQFDQIAWEVSTFDFLSKINHPFLLKGYEKIESLQSIYLIYEYPTEGLLLFYLQKNQITSVRKLVEIFVLISSSIDYLHSFGFIYGNCIASNMFVFKLKKIIYYKFIDFTCSQVVPLTLSEVKGGQKNNNKIKPFNKNKDYNQALDVWNLGCLLFTMIYGDQPFMNKDSKNKSLIFPDVVFDNDDKSIIKQVNDIITGCLNSDNKKRYLVSEIIKKCQNLK